MSGGGRRPGRVSLALEVVRTYVVARRLQGVEDLPSTLASLREQPADAGTVDYHEGLRLARAVTRTLRMLPGADSRCLMQSLVLLTMLARRGQPAALVIGVRPGEDFGAHAWIELRGRPLLPTFGDDFARLVEL
jgi:hypothetical protein